MAKELRVDAGDVFICYERENKVLVSQICETLKSQGVSVAWDEDVVGGVDWAEWADTAIHKCKVVLVMCTESSLKAPNVRNEVVQGADGDKALIPLMLEKDLLYPPGMKMRLSRFNRIEICSRPAGEWLPELLRALDASGVRFRRLVTPPDGLIAETTAWIDKLTIIAARLQTAPEASPVLSDEILALEQTALLAAKLLNEIDKRQLPSLYQTLAALSLGEHVEPVEATALRLLQGSLVDVARILMHGPDGKLGALGELPLPPYDLWLPFKSGSGKAPTASTA